MTFFEVWLSDLHDLQLGDPSRPRIESPGGTKNKSCIGWENSQDLFLRGVGLGVDNSSDSNYSSAGI